MIATLLGLMLKVVLLVALGYYVKRKGMISDETERGLSNLLVNIIFPISAIASADNDFSADKLKNILIMMAIALVYYIAAILISTKAGRLLGLSNPDQRIFMTMSTFANTAYIGIPVVVELYGSEGMLYAVIYNMFYQFFFFTYGIAMLNGDGHFRIRDAWNPCIQSALLACGLFLLQIQLPSPVQSTIKSVGDMVVPLSMMIIGFGLTDIRFREVLSDYRAYYVSLLRLLVFPLLVFLGCRLFHVNKELTMIGMIMSGIPSGSMNVIMAKQYGCDMDYATKGVIQSMIFGVVTLPLMVAAGNLLGLG